ncbi:MAG: hypothetical protein WCZ17_11065 [Candidatus Kapaibacterium sp.]|jgi:hypothetical protein|nr:hypothetical protein [Candidatus Kapabacteria bacterium]
MKKLILTPILGFVFCISSYVLNSQNPPCYPEYQGLNFVVPLNQNCPPYSTDMPLDVFIGYIALDSVTRNVEIEDYYTFMNRQTYNDTIKTMMRYFYKMVEFNPVKYLNYKHSGQINKFEVMDYEHSFYDYVKRISPEPILDASLLASFVIAKISVSSVENYIVPTARNAKTISLITANIDSLIKGNSLITCSGPPVIGSSNVENCIKFEIAKEWFVNNPEFEMIPGQSYFVFYDYRLICKSETSSYFTIFPLRFAGSMTNSIYPVINDNLIDVFNELGFGTSVNLNTFYNGIQNRINQIKNFTP